MIDPLRLFLNSQFKRSKLIQKNGGFTLIELLVGLVLAGLVITPIMSFMTNILETTRKEEAKANTEQEIQSAVDYITRDLKQAIYIYDAKGLSNISSTDPANSGIKDQIPPIASAPGCVNNPPNDICTPVLVFWKRELKNDAFVYSLVGYYLIKGNNNNENWSDAARIGRFQISDGVNNSTNLTNINSPNITQEERSSGFQLFNLRVPGSLAEKMNNWQKADENYTSTVDTLVDFIAESTNEITSNCPENMQQVPSNLVGGFYACVDSSNNSAQISVIGNALARIRNEANCDRQSVYCPTATVRVQGRGLLNAD